MTSRFWCAAVPLLIMYAYQLIPARLRRLWSGACSSSTLAVAAVLCGMNGWAALWRYGHPRLRRGPAADNGFWSDWLMSS